MDMFLNQYMEKMIDFGIQTTNLDNILYYGGYMVGIVLIGVICGVLSGVFTNLASFRATNNLRKDVFKKIMNLSYHQTDQFSTGSLVIRVTNDITQLQNMISMTLRMLIRAISMFILGVVFTLSIDPAFGIVIAIVLPLEIIVMLFFVKFGFPYFTIMQKKIDKVNTVVHENVSGARVVKAFGKEEYEDNRFKRANDDYATTMLKVNKLLSALIPLLMLLIYAGTIAIYSIGGNSIISGFNGLIPFSRMLMVGEISQAITYITMICMSLMVLGMFFIVIARASASAKRIKEVLDCDLEIVDGNYDVSTSNCEGSVEFKNVNFHYPDDKGNVLNDINLKINGGETIAIVGATGAGKSTLVNLITRFYDVSDGQILVDGVDVRDYKQQDLRSKIAICLQKSEMFAGTIAENIRWGKQDASDEEVKEAADIAQASEFIGTKKDGFNERVEEKGTSLSGGQKQRLAIARAILKRPEIIIFDDSTSALDLVTEAKLYAAMRKNINHITKIVVAQRIATARNADRIIVLDQGTIIAFDNHDNLMESCDTYRDIYNSQLGEGSVFDE